ncbi:uncharacterized protein LOC126627413 [Malus sylvestris]|uniref:uncharacterized protein LOC126627413 n=1 Tax=Malus sylvestris TaxID=3752 RepID=UPI0021AD224B|nr:uncharacterized protein LOC126627413 [Malus sylvestris]
MCNSNNMHIKKILDHHTCGRLWMNRNMKQFWLTEHYLEKIQLNPTWHVESFMDTIEAEWKHGCSKMKAYRDMIAAMKIIEGKHVEQYTRLWDFAEEINKTNPGSIVKIKLDEGMFQMMYVCLGACKEGFKHGCRPLIGLDGCHLKSQHGGNCWLLWGYVTPYPVFKIFLVLIDEPNGPPLYLCPRFPFLLLSLFSHSFQTPSVSFSLSLIYLSRQLSMFLSDATPPHIHTLILTPNWPRRTTHHHHSDLHSLPQISDLSLALCTVTVQVFSNEGLNVKTARGAFSIFFGKHRPFRGNFRPNHGNLGVMQGLRIETNNPGVKALPHRHLRVILVHQVLNMEHIVIQVVYQGKGERNPR